MELKPGYYKTRDGLCAVVITKTRDSFIGFQYDPSWGWENLGWNVQGMAWLGERDLISPWPKDEPIPPGLPKIIFDEEPAQVKSAFDEEYWRNLRHELILDLFKRHPGEPAKNIIEKVDELTELLKERT